MSKIVNPNTVSFGRWEMTTCVDCDNEYQVTRTEPKTLALHACVCSDCKLYNDAYQDGFNAAMSKTKKVSEEDTDIFGKFEKYLATMKNDLSYHLKEEDYSMVAELSNKIYAIEEFKRYVEGSIC